tara:strand:+ start:219 stop:692 length:474 start_codon:yes stop_codon:yes gene_type:complete
MSLEYCSIEEAWGNVDSFKTKKVQNPPTTKNNTTLGIQKDVSYSNNDMYGQYSSYDSSNSHFDDDYTQSYCESIINHIQGCAYCKKVIMTRLNNTCQPCEPDEPDENDNYNNLDTSILNRRHDNLAYIPFNLEPEVFNVLLFSILSIILLTLFDKHK